MKKFVPAVILLLTVLAAAGWLAAWKAESARHQLASRNTAPEGSPKAPASNEVAPVSPAPTQKDAPGTARPEKQIVKVPPGVDPAEYIQVIEDLRRKNADLARELSEAREEASKAEANRAGTAMDLEAAQRQIVSIRDDLESARRVVTALQAELDARNQRLARAETNEKIAAERAKQKEASAERLTESAREMEEINRRRDVYLTSLVRRYREVADLYRSFSLHVQNRDNQNTGLQAGDLSRIQASMQQAEEDLRQIQTLNARAAQLSRRN
jgi:hypothetical protein